MDGRPPRQAPMRPGGLEVVGLAMRRQGVLRGVHLQHLVDVGFGAALGQLVHQAAGFIGLHLGRQVREHLFQVRALALGRRQRRHNTDHLFRSRTLV